MKLQKCHIENFGKLANLDYQFSQGLNLFNEENGWGKTTFATFIKAMFYGLPSTSKRSLDENERKKYKPWQGGNYGGYIEFEIGEKSFRLTRFFGKNGSEDIFELVDLSTGKKSQAYSASIGEEIFGLDEEAFERSAFIPQKSLNTLVNESISNKLTNLMHGTNEQFNIESALALLDRNRASLSNNKKTGQIQMLEDEVEELLFQINSLKTSAQSIETLENQVEEENNKIKSLIEKQKLIKEKMAKIAKIKEKIANKDLYYKYCEQIGEIEREISTSAEILNNQVIGVEEINDFSQREKDVVKLQEKVKALNDGYVSNRFYELSNYFDDEEELINEENLKNVQEKINRYNAIKLQQELPAMKQEKSEKKEKKFYMSLVFLVLTIGFVIAGILTLNKVEILPIVMFVAGGLSLLLSGFIYLKNQINSENNSLQKIDQLQLQQNKIELASLEKELNEFLFKFERNTDDVDLAFGKVRANLSEFEKIKKQFSENQKTINEYKKQIEEEKEKINDFLSKFNFQSFRQFDNLEKLDLLKKSVISISNLKERLNIENENLEKFKKEKHFDVKDEEIQNIDILSLQEEDEALQKQIDSYKENRASIIAKINKINEDISEIDELENKKEEKLSQISSLSEKFCAIKNAMKFLKSADESLSSKLLSPMKEGLKKYLEKITGKDYKNIQLDTDFNITFDEYGQSREIDFYSKGYQNIIDLCMRLALIETLFDKEKPFVVVDDAFVNLDEKKIDKAKQFLKELAKEFQVIYFVCHNSRA